MLPKRFWLQNEAFMKEIPEPESCPGGLEREVAKWQNRVILPCSITQQEANSTADTGSGAGCCSSLLWIEEEIPH